MVLNSLLLMSTTSSADSDGNPPPVDPSDPGAGGKYGGLSSLLVSLAINLALCLGAFIAYTLLQWGFPRIYHPRLFYAKDTRRPRRPRRGMFGWISAVFEIPEDELVETAGLDAAMYVRYFRVALQIFSINTVIGMCVLIPVNMYSAPEEDQLDGLDYISLSNVPYNSPYLWAHFVCVYVFSMVVFRKLTRTYEEYVRLRHRYLQKQEEHNFSVMVLGIPHDWRSPEGICGFFQTIYKDRFVCATITEDMPELERAYAKQKAIQDKLEHLKMMKEIGERPLYVRTLTLKEIPAEDYYLKELSKANEELIHLLETLEPRYNPTGFVTFTDVVTAASAVKVIHSASLKHWILAPAPEPRDIIWANLRLTQDQKWVRQALVFIAVFWLVAFYTIPVTFVSSLTTLEALSERFPALTPIVQKNALIKGFLQGFLPSLALMVFLSVLPYILEKLTIMQGVEAKSWVECGVMNKLFIFQIVNAFLMVAIVGSVFGKLEELAQNPTYVTNLLGTSIPQVGTYFMNFVMLRLTTLPIRLLRIVPLILSQIRLHAMVKTEKQRQDAEHPGPLSYGTEYPNHMLIFILGITYAPIAPLILIFVLVFFMFGYVVARQQALYVYIRQYESGGQFWPIAFRHIMIGMLVNQLTLIGVLGVKGGTLQAYLLLPLPILSLLVWYKGYQMEKHGHVLPLILAYHVDVDHPPSRHTSVTGSSDHEDTQPSEPASPREYNPLISIGISATHSVSGVVKPLIRTAVKTSKTLYRETKRNLRSIGIKLPKKKYSMECPGLEAVEHAKKCASLGGRYVHEFLLAERIDVQEVKEEIDAHEEKELLTLVDDDISPEENELEIEIESPRSEHSIDNNNNNNNNNGNNNSTKSGHVGGGSSSVGGNTVTNDDGSSTNMEGAIELEAAGDDIQCVFCGRPVAEGTIVLWKRGVGIAHKICPKIRRDHRCHSTTSQPNLRV